MYARRPWGILATSEGVLGSIRVDRPRPTIHVAFLVALLAVPAAARAGGFDLRSWIDRSGVKLVAVEFYATWCEPCMEAVPRWRELHERYRNRGLRLIVVNTQDPEGRCFNPGWNPDEMVCDPEGDLARSLGVGSSLPSAFVWSWQGNLLVRQGHVDEVERAVERYLRETPRVAVEARSSRGKPSEGLRALVRDAISASGKLEVVASREERALLRRIRKESHSLGMSERLACEVGMEVPANSVLQVSVSKERRGKRLNLTLLSAETGCLLAAATVPWVKEQKDRSVHEAVDKLHARLRGKLQMPGVDSSAGPRRRPADGPIGEEPPDWAPEGASATVVQLQSDPEGAVVLVDGELVCRATPCSKELVAGAHQVSMQLEQYVTRNERVVVQEGKGIRWTLEPDFGWLAVRSDPPGLPVLLDGEEVGSTPLARRQLPPGMHEVVVASPCHYEAGERVTLERGAEHTVDVAPKVKEGAIDVSARDPGDNAVTAEVLVDGVPVGRTPGVFRVGVCAKRVEVRHEAAGSWSQELQVAERKTASLVAALPKAALRERAAEAQSELEAETSAAEALPEAVGRAAAAAPETPDRPPPPHLAPPAEEEAGPSATLPFVLAGVSVAAAGAATVLSFVFEGAADDAYRLYAEPGSGRFYDEAYYEEEVVANVGKAQVTRVAGIGLGAAALATLVWGLSRLGGGDEVGAVPSAGGPGGTLGWGF